MSNLISIKLAEQAMAVRDADNERLKAELTDCKAQVERLECAIITGNAITPDAKPPVEEPDYLSVHLYATEQARLTMKNLRAENVFLKMEIDRLKNNCDYLDFQLSKFLPPDKTL